MKIHLNGSDFEIDDSDASVFQSRKWKVMESANGYKYIEYRTPLAEGHKSILFHREIMGASKGQFVDHIDGDTKNNKRSNLRICTHAQNMKNRKINKNSKTGAKGVSARGRRFRACITSDGIRKILGTFETIEQAHAAYCTAAIALHGEFARFE